MHAGEMLHFERQQLELATKAARQACEQITE